MSSVKWEDCTEVNKRYGLTETYHIFINGKRIFIGKWDCLHGGGWMYHNASDKVWPDVTRIKAASLEEAKALAVVLTRME